MHSKLRFHRSKALDCHTIWWYLIKKTSKRSVFEGVLNIPQKNIKNFLTFFEILEVKLVLNWGTKAGHQCLLPWEHLHTYQISSRIAQSVDIVSSMDPERLRMRRSLKAYPWAHNTNYVHFRLHDSQYNFNTYMGVISVLGKSCCWVWKPRRCPILEFSIHFLKLILEYLDEPCAIKIQDRWNSHHE